MRTSPVTLVTHTCVRPERTDEFIRQQQQLNDAVATFPEYIDHTIVPPTPPVQTDWVIVQRFQSVAAAQAWLQSEQRLRLLDTLQPLLVGKDDIHLFTDDEPHHASGSVSTIISTQVKPGQEEAFRQWYRRISAAQTKFPGFQGYKLEPPIPGVQEDWVTILRFDSDAHLEAWLNSEHRKQILQEADAFSSDTHMRKARVGFEAWVGFSGGAQQDSPPMWKVNMIVLLGLYPTVFLFSLFVQTPLLIHNGMPFWLALFFGNAFSTALLGWFLVPQLSKLLGWWLQPSESTGSQSKLHWITWAGAALILVCYAALLLIFSTLP
jgi:antibiotic biosynthesis monooxygenase (ABM) superfamily enzyme